MPLAAAFGARPPHATPAAAADVGELAGVVAEQTVGVAVHVGHRDVEVAVFVEVEPHRADGLAACRRVRSHAATSVSFPASLRNSALARSRKPMKRSRSPSASKSIHAGWRTAPVAIVKPASAVASANAPLLLRYSFSTDASFSGVKPTSRSGSPSASTSPHAAARVGRASATPAAAATSVKTPLSLRYKRFGLPSKPTNMSRSPSLS